ncbi:MAG: hypothetical protein HKN81_05485 [Gammaproteobacteria bacterium]|nr:hypothetical protein [Gammaproteobacteria bacterium]
MSGSESRIIPGLRRGTALLCLLLTSSATWAGTSVQPGFYYHEPANIDLQLTSIRSGVVCSDEQGPTEVCETAQKIVITGDETCEYSPGTFYPCTRFGYQFDYSGATAGAAIACTVKRTDPMGRRSTADYTHELSEGGGRVFFPTFRTYGPVENRAIFSEVHECAYQGQRLTNIEYIIYYEPGTASAQNAGQPADRLFPEAPLACGAPHLTEQKAGGLLGAQKVKPSAANEHIPKIWSQCIYSAKQGPARQVGFVYKFMLSDMFDVDKLAAQQVQFNATFASGGAELRETRNELGDRAFVFQKGDRTSLLVITGIKGPKDFAGRSTEFTANYYLDHPDLTHEQRAGMLIDQAQLDLRSWGE